MLAVLAADTQTSKGPDAKPQPVLLTADAAVQAAAAAVLASGEYKAGANETLLLHAPAGLAAKRLLIVGLGKQAKITVAQGAQRRRNRRPFRQAARHPGAGLRAAESELLPAAPAARAAVEGAFVGDFDPDTYRSDRKDQSIESFTLAAPGRCGPSSRSKPPSPRPSIIGESQNFTRTLVNEPGNKLTPTILGQRAAQMAAGGWPRLGGPLHRKAARAEDGRILERLARLGRAARADRAAL